MLYRLERLCSENIFAHFNLELVSNRLVMFNYKLTNGKNSFGKTTIHKLFYSGDYPPFDISFDLETGFVKEISVFYPIGNIIDIKQNWFPEKQVEKGYPSFVFFNLEQNQYHYSETKEIKLVLAKQGLTLYLNNVESKFLVQINQKTYLHIDFDGQIAGFSFAEPKIYEALRNGFTNFCPFICT